MVYNNRIRSRGNVVWRQFLIGQTFGVAFAVVLFSLEVLWRLSGLHSHLGASLVAVLAVFTTFGWVLGALVGVVSGLAGAAWARLRRADGTVPGTGPVTGFILMALFLLRMETPQTMKSLPPTVLTSLGAAVLVWVGLGYLGRRFLDRKVPTRRRPLLLNLLALVAFVAFVGPVALSRIESGRLPARTPPSAEAPNVVLIVVDALRPDHLSFGGYERATSPNLDAFASRSTVFRNAYAHGTRAGVAVPALFSSRYPCCGEAQGGRALTLAEMCRSEGYTTVGVAGGKMLEAAPAVARGFDVLDEFEVLRYGLSVYRALAALGMLEAPTHAPAAPDASAVTDAGVRWIRCLADRPFFLFLNYADALPPYAPPHEYERVFVPDPGDIDNALLHMKSQAMADGPASVRLEAGELDRLVDLYDATVLYIDDQIGRLLGELEAAYPQRETVVIVTADRGTEFMEHGSLYNANVATEELIRVPLIIGRVPGDLFGGATGRVVRHIDVLPTVAGLIGIPVPPGVHGVGLEDQMAGGTPGGLRNSIAEGEKCVSLNQDFWKLLYVDSTETYHLYDLKADRLGQVDVSRRYAGRAAEMKALVDEYLSMRAGMPLDGEQLMSGDVTR